MKRLSYEEWEGLEYDPCEFWDADDTAEYLHNCDLDEAVSEHVDNMHPDIITPGDELEVFGWAAGVAPVTHVVTVDLFEYCAKHIPEALESHETT